MKNEYSVKELADLLGVSKSTIQRAIVSAAIDPAREGRQKRYYDQEGTTRIIELVSPGFDVSGLFPAIQTAPETEATEAETAPTAPGEPVQTDTTAPGTEATEAKALQTAVEALQKELEAKNRQIEAQEEQINRLLQTIQAQSNTITGLTESIKGAQALAAGDKLLLLDKKNTQEEKDVIDAQEAPAGETLPDDQEETAAGQPEKKGFFSRLWHNLTN